ncbi:16S rRNA (cytidine(1402)-2'-O)-methyltransferase [Cardiobacteriaceae bacterium TAE3-ERU3]|nr:16S rRNA (cytidine(1402)-2'-O)-methyltransferase [Cardiobacteriaceae bacterium TAE3-ERU3]
MGGEFVKHERWSVSGVLYIVATPIGNLQDITARGQAILAQVDAIACEDTRHSRRLLDAYGIDKPLIALHQHNEHSASEMLLGRLRAGENIALVSDAGTPLISDPGQWLTRVALEQEVPVVPIPGVSSVMTALSVSGLPADQFVFAGFIPSKAGERTRFIETHGKHPMTTVFFETPHRIAASIAALAEQLDGSRMIVFARELTKQFEQIARMPLAEAADWLAADSNRSRGEFVLLLEGQSAAVSDEAQWQQMAIDLVHAGVSSKDCAALVAKYTGAKKKLVYQYIVDTEKS